jgi:hypothetical protein
MIEVQIKYHEDATSVALVAANDEYWLWFTTGTERRMRPQLVSRDQIGEALADDISDARAKDYLETQMQKAGYKLQRSAIQSGDIAVWAITSG